MMVGYDHLDYSNFFWRTQNSLFGVKYTKKGVECQKTLMITNSNQAWLAKMAVCGLQEEVLGNGGANNTYNCSTVVIHQN